MTCMTKIKRSVRHCVDLKLVKVTHTTPTGWGTPRSKGGVLFNTRGIRTYGRLCGWELHLPFRYESDSSIFDALVVPILFHIPQLSALRTQHHGQRRVQAQGQGGPATESAVSAWMEVS